MKKQLAGKAIGLYLAGCLLLALGGCGSADSMSSNGMKATMTTDMVASESADYMSESYDDSWGTESYVDTEVSQGQESVGESAALSSTSRKLIRTVNLEVETKEFDAAIDTLQQQVLSLGGYIENMDLYNGSNYSGYRSSRNASMTIRIPQNKTDDFLNAVSDISNVISHSESVDDVTLSYADMESHKSVLRAEHTRLLEFLEQADSIEDMLTIEKRLSDIQYQLESIESQLRTYDNKVDYSTVRLTVDEVKELTPIVEEEEEEPTTWERIRDGFVENCNNVLDGLKELMIWFVVNIPNFILLAVCVLIFVGIIRLILRKGKKKEPKKKEQKKEQKDMDTSTRTDEQNENPDRKQ